MSGKTFLKKSHSIKPESPTGRMRGKEFLEEGTAGAKALKRAAGRQGLTQPRTAGSILAAVYQCPVCPSCVDVVEC